MKIVRNKKVMNVSVGDICIGTQSGDSYLICHFTNMNKYGVVNITKNNIYLEKFDTIDELLEDWGFSDVIPAKSVEVNIQG